jgi:uncharacterized protein with FMN-binding domain
MKRIATWIFATIGGLVLVFSYRTSTQEVAPISVPDGAPVTPAAAPQPGAAAPPPAAANTPAPPARTPATSAPAIPAPATSAPPQPAATDAGRGLFADGTYTGASIDTRFGPVQVQITVSGGQVVSASAIDYPTHSRTDRRLNEYAIPILQDATLGTVDGNIDMVSGAPYTSRGYINSLQDALDQAGR